MRQDAPPLLRRRWFPRPGHHYKQVRCALCYLRFWPWQKRHTGANYFPHPYMQVHRWCGELYLKKLAHERERRAD